MAAMKKRLLVSWSSGKDSAWTLHLLHTHRAAWDDLVVRVDAAVMYAVPKVNSLSIRIGAAHVLTGRNVGQSTSFTTGVFHALRF